MHDDHVAAGQAARSDSTPGPPGMARLSRPAMNAWCPDCGARTIYTPERPRGLTHDDCCPIAMGTDAATASDHNWFEAHPLIRCYRRPVTAAEAAELRWLGQPVPRTVRVYQIERGLRVRDFTSALPGHPADLQ
jgi:hypothetical protein